MWISGNSANGLAFKFEIWVENCKAFNANGIFYCNKLRARLKCKCPKFNVQTACTAQVA